MELADKTVIVTGASSGIGAAAALRFAQEGAAVVLGARRLPELEAVAARVAAAGGRAVVLGGDVRDEDFAPALVELALSAYGRLDGAFNNAGIVGTMQSAETMDLGAWEAVLATNLTGAFLAARAQIPALRRAGGGAIVFTSSFVGTSNGGLPGMGAYAASKAGMIGLARSLAADHAAEGIRVNALLPGGTITPAGGEGHPEVLATVAALHAMKRMARPEEIADAAVFLLSDRASFMTGSSVLVDGGLSARLG